MVLPRHKWLPCKVSRSYTFCKRRYKVFSSSRDLTWPRGQRIMWHHGWILLIISQHLVKFGGSRLGGITNIKLLNSHVTSSYYVVRESCDIFGMFASWKFVTILLTEYEVFCFYEVMWPHVTTWSMGYVALWVGVFHPKSPPRRPYISFCWKCIISSYRPVLTCGLCF